MSIDTHKKFVEGLAVACMHLAVGRAVLDFPESTMAGPSRFVQVSLEFRGSLANRFQAYFPMQVESGLWHQVVVPILEDARFKIQTSEEVPTRTGVPTTKITVTENHVLRSFFQGGQWDSLMDFYAEALIQGCQDAGYLPTDEQMGSPAVIVTSDHGAPGEPVIRSDLPDPLTYTQFDC